MENIKELLRHTESAIQDIQKDFEKHHLEPSLESDLSRLISNMESLNQVVENRAVEKLEVGEGDLIDSVKNSIQKLRSEHGKEMEKEVSKMIPHLDFSALMKAFDDGLDQLKKHNIEKGKVGRKSKTEL